MNRPRRQPQQVASTEGGLSRRAFLAGAGSAAAYVALSGATGISLSPAEARSQARAMGIDGEARGLSAGTDRLVAVGRDAEGAPAVWTAESPDDEWEASRLGDAFADAELHGVGQARGAYLALGAVTVRETVRFEPASTDIGGDETYEFSYDRRVPAVWRSDDASSWERQLLDAEVDGNGVLAAVAGDGRRIVAVGSRLDSDAAEGVGALVVHSDDGRTWRRASIRGGDGDLAEGGLTGVTTQGGTWAAVGGHIEGGTVLSSSDGVSWGVWDAADSELGHVPLQAIVATRGALIAAGEGIEDAEAVLFASEDAGSSWGTDKARLRSLNRPDATVSDLEVSDRDSSLLAIGAQAGKPTVERGDVR